MRLRSKDINMNIADFKNEVFNQIQLLRSEDREAGYLLLNRTLFEDIRREAQLRDIFIHKYEQRDTIKGDTLMGMTICVSEQSRRLCKVVAV